MALKPRTQSSLKFHIFFPSCSNSVRTSERDWSEKQRFSSQRWSYLTVIHSSLRTPAMSNSLCVASPLWQLMNGANSCCVGGLWGTALLNGINRTEGKPFIASRPGDQEEEACFLLLSSANESLLPTQIISLCLSFTFYKVRIIIPIPPYFLSILSVEIIAYVNPGEERLKSKHHYYYFFLANSLHGNHSFLELMTHATPGLVT